MVIFWSQAFATNLIVPCVAHLCNQSGSQQKVNSRCLQQRIRHLLIMLEEKSSQKIIKKLLVVRRYNCWNESGRI